MTTKAFCSAAVLALVLVPSVLLAQGQAVTVERSLAIPKKDVAQARHAIGLDRALVISTGDGVLVLGKDEAAPKRLPVPGAWLAETPGGFVVVTDKAVTFRDHVGDIRKEFLGARPVFMPDGRPVALQRMVDGSPGITFLNDDLTVSAEYALRGLPSALVLDRQARKVLSNVPGHTPFSPSQSIVLWQRDKVLLDILKKYPRSGLLRASPAGRIYLNVLGEKGSSVVCLDSDGKEVWKKDVPDKSGRVLFEAAALRQSEDAVFIGYEDPAFKDQPGKLRLLLLDASGRVIRDCSEGSYNAPVVSRDGSCAMLAGKGNVQGLEVASGKTIWRKDTSAFLGGEDPRKAIGSGICQAGSTQLYVLLVASKPKEGASPGEATVLGFDMKTGGLVYRKKLPGAAWKLHVSRGGTIWVVSDEGKVRYIRVQGSK